ncbi:Vesicle-associated protein 4-2 [Glycine soja]|nr:Vesicle-associated protein 4-2 [Glycine soja]
MISLRPYNTCLETTTFLFNPSKLGISRQTQTCMIAQRKATPRRIEVKCSGAENKGERTFLTLEEAGLVEISGLSTHERFLCRLTISSLNLLRVISEQEGCPIEELNAAKICDWVDDHVAASRAWKSWKNQAQQSKGKVWNLFKLRFLTPPTLFLPLPDRSSPHLVVLSFILPTSSTSLVCFPLLPIFPSTSLHLLLFILIPLEPGKQAKSAVRIKNTSKSNVAFKFQTNAPKSCFMRPPGGILAPGESIIATVFKFIEHPLNNEKPQKTGVKFKITSLKVKGPIDYVPEMFDELKDQVTVEQILQVVFLDPERSCPKERRERYLAKQQGEVVVDSI